LSQLDPLSPIVADSAPGVGPTAGARFESAGSASGPGWAGRLTSLALTVAAILAVLSVIGFLAIRFSLWPALDRWRPELEGWLSNQLEAQVTVERLEPGFSAGRPTLAVQGLRVRVPGHTSVASARSVEATLSIRALLTGRLQLDRLEIDAPQLALERLEPGRWIVAGTLIDLGHTGQVPRSWGWLLDTRQVTLHELTIDWVDRVTRQERRLENIGFNLATSKAGRLQLALEVPALDRVAQGLTLRVDAQRPAVVQGFDPRGMRGEIHLQADAVEWHELAREWAAWPNRPAWADAIRGGRGALMLWAEFAEGEWRDLLVKARAEAINLAVAERMLPLRELSLEAAARRGLGPLVEVEIDHFRASDGRGLTIALDGGPQRVVLDSVGLQPVELSLSAKSFDAGALWSAAQRLPLPDGLMRQISPWRASGKVDSVGVDWRRGETGATYTIRADFQGLSLRRAPSRRPSLVARWPSFTNLTGRALIGHQGGRAWLDSKQVQLDVPGLFAQPTVSLNTLSGVLDWSLGPVNDPVPTEPGTFELKFNALKLANPDFSGEIDGRYSLPATGGPGAVDMRGQLSRASGARVARYLPLAVDASVRQWVEAAVRGGQSGDTRFVVRGDLRDFPFRDPSRGEFLVESQVDRAALKFAPDWPELDAIEATLRFDRAGMLITADRAQTRGLALKGITARIDDFRNPDLIIQGQGEGDAASMLAYLDQTPLRQQIDPAVSAFGLQGRAKLALSLDLSLARPRPPRYSGVINLSDGQLTWGLGIPPISAMAAQIHFGHDQFEIRNINGQLLGGSVQALARMGRDRRLRIEATGRAEATSIEHWLAGQRSGEIQGLSDYRLDIEAGREETVLELVSELSGLSSRLPQPLAKEAGARWPLRLEWRRTRAQSPLSGNRAATESLRLRLRDDVVLHTDRELDPSTDQYEFVRGSLSVGGQPLEHLDRGFAVTARVPQLDLDAWRAVLARLDPPPASLRSSEGDPRQAAVPPGFADRVTLHAGQIKLAGRTFADVDLTGEKSPESWRFRVRTTELEGRIDWSLPSDAAVEGRVTGRFTRLELPSRPIAESHDAPDDRPTSRLPALDIEADRLVLGGRELGGLRLAAVNVEPASGEGAFWRLDRLELSHPGGRLTASGSWRPPRLSGGSEATGLPSGTELDFVLSLTDPGRVLSTFGIKGALSGGVGRLSGRMAWRGTPMSIDYPSMSGWLDVELRRGQFLKTEPGIAKLIGVLNLQSLPRRLSLDFRDLIAEGFAFDEIRGAASLAGGIARTEDFRMRGVQALVEIRGAADLAAETQDLRVRVRPEMNAGLASLAYAAVANPAVGLGSFLAQLALRKPLQELFSYEYEVAGSWADPTVIEKARPRVEQPAP